MVQNKSFLVNDMLRVYNPSHAAWVLSSVVSSVSQIISQTVAHFTLYVNDRSEYS